MKYFLLLCVAALSACASMNVQQTQLSSDIRASEFNSIAAQYVPKPTYMTLYTRENGSEYIGMMMSSYGQNAVGGMLLPPEKHVVFYKENVPEYFAIFDKYEQWRQTALSRGDALTKDIGRVDGEGLSYKYSFHSGNADQHYLAIAFCSAFCLTPEVVLDAQNVERLRDLLRRWQEGDVRPLDADAIYN